MLKTKHLTHHLEPFKAPEVRTFLVVIDWMPLCIDPFLKLQRYLCFWERVSLNFKLPCLALNLPFQIGNFPQKWTNSGFSL